MSEDAKRKLHPDAEDPIRELHRTWGVGLSTTDVDCLLLEFDYGDGGPGDVVGAIEYKLGLDRQLEADEQEMLKVVARFCDASMTPAFIVKYGNGKGAHPWTFRVWPLNEIATSVMVWERGTEVSEREFVRFLWSLRGRRAPQELLDRLPAETR